MLKLAYAGSSAGSGLIPSVRCTALSFQWTGEQGHGYELTGLLHVLTHPGLHRAWEHSRELSYCHRVAARGALHEHTHTPAPQSCVCCAMSTFMCAVLWWGGGQVLCCVYSPIPQQLSSFLCLAYAPLTPMPSAEQLLFPLTSCYATIQAVRKTRAPSRPRETACLPGSTASWDTGGVCIGHLIFP